MRGRPRWRARGAARRRSAVLSGIATHDGEEREPARTVPARREGLAGGAGVARRGEAARSGDAGRRAPPRDRALPDGRLRGLARGARPGRADRAGRSAVPPVSRPRAAPGGALRGSGARAGARAGDGAERGRARRVLLRGPRLGRCGRDGEGARVARPRDRDRAGHAVGGRGGARQGEPRPPRRGRGDVWAFARAGLEYDDNVRLRGTEIFPQDEGDRRHARGVAAARRQRADLGPRLGGGRAGHLLRLGALRPHRVQRALPGGRGLVRPATRRRHLAPPQLRRSATRGTSTTRSCSRSRRAPRSSTISARPAAASCSRRRTSTTTCTP